MLPLPLQFFLEVPFNNEGNNQDKKMGEIPFINDKVLSMFLSFHVHDFQCVYISSFCNLKQPSVLVINWPNILY